MVSSYFNHIPDEILVYIFHFLSSSDLCSVATMNPRFDRVVRTRSLWIKADIGLSNVLRTLHYLHDGIKSLDINVTPGCRKHADVPQAQVSIPDQSHPAPSWLHH
jgi:hypothetical protein